MGHDPREDQGDPRQEEIIHEGTEAEDLVG